MMNAFIPPVTPSGQRLERTVTRSTEDLLMRVATGKLVHSTVPTLLAYYGHPEITSVPIDGLPPSETALAWLTANRSPKVQAFARAAADVLGRSSPLTDQ